MPSLDEVKKGEVCAIVAMGCTREIAAKYVGCCRSTVFRTALRDPAFHDALRQAEAKHEMMHLKLIGEAAKAKQYWRAAAWVLERKYPERYAARDPDTLTVAQHRQVLRQFFELVAKEVKNKQTRERLLAAFDQLAGKPPKANVKQTKRRPAASVLEGDGEY